MHQLIRENLREKRRTLDNWFTNAPLEDARSAWGQPLSASLPITCTSSMVSSPKPGMGLFGLCDVCHLHIGTQHLEMDYTASVCIDHFTEPEVRQLER